MSQQHITIGTANAGGGDTPFSAFTKVEANFTDIYSKGFGLSAAVILSAATTVTGTSSNTLKYIFDSLGTTPIAGVGTWLSNTTAATSGNQQISPSVLYEAQGFNTGSSSSQSLKVRQYILPVQQSISLSGGNFVTEVSVNGGSYNTLWSVDINTGKTIIKGDIGYDQPPLIEMVRHSGGSEIGRGQMGFLGSTEMNMTVNMDYTDGTHKYFDTAKNAIWTYLSNITNGWGIQWVKSGHPNNDTMWTTYGKIVYNIDVIPNTGTGEAVTGGSAITLQKINMIDDDYSSSPALFKLHATVLSITGPSAVSIPALSIGRSVGGTELAGLKATGAVTLLIQENADNNTNYNSVEYLKNKAGSYNLGAGTKVFEGNYNTIAFDGVRATSTVLSTFSNLEFYWQTTNAGGVTADRMILGQDGSLTLSGGKIIQDSTITAGGTTGNQTINKATGTVNIAAAGTSVTVTNSLVTTSSLVYTIIRTNDSTATIKNVVPGSGSFIITLAAAATAEVSIGFIVFN